MKCKYCGKENDFIGGWVGLIMGVVITLLCLLVVRLTKGV